LCRYTEVDKRSAPGPGEYSPSAERNRVSLNSHFKSGTDRFGEKAAMVAGRGLHSFTFQLNLSRV
jgi:hypothetical protein